MKSFFSFLLWIIPFLCPAQDTAALAATVEKQAGMMAEAFTAKDYKRFVNYNHPVIIQLAGGKEGMITLLKTSIAEMEKEGFLILSCAAGKASRIVQYKDELQCTIPQTLQLKVPGGSMLTVSTLIGISSDKGVNWTFIDTQGKPLEELKKTFPGFSNDLVIPAKTAPVLTKD